MPSIPTFDAAESACLPFFLNILFFPFHPVLLRGRR